MVRGPRRAAEMGGVSGLNGAMTRVQTLVSTFRGGTDPDRVRRSCNHPLMKVGGGSVIYWSRSGRRRACRPSLD